MLNCGYKCETCSDPNTCDTYKPNRDINKNNCDCNDGYYEDNT